MDCYKYLYCIQAVNQSGFMECYWYACCVQAVNQSVYMVHWMLYCKNPCCLQADNQSLYIMECYKDSCCVKLSIKVCIWYMECCIARIHVVYKLVIKVCTLWNVTKTHVVSSCQSKWVFGMLQLFMMFTSCQSKCVHGTWCYRYSCCVQIVNQSVYMQFYMYSCCLQVVNHLSVYTLNVTNRGALHKVLIESVYMECYRYAWYVQTVNQSV